MQNKYNRSHSLDRGVLMIGRRSREPRKAPKGRHPTLPRDRSSDYLFYEVRSERTFTCSQFRNLKSHPDGKTSFVSRVNKSKSRMYFWDSRESRCGSFLARSKYISLIFHLLMTCFLFFRLVPYQSQQMITPFHWSRPGTMLSFVTYGNQSLLEGGRE